MTAEIVDAVLWRARCALRVDALPLLAGHGLADALYRPPRLPYASVLGPLSYRLEPERDVPREAVLIVRTPGYLAGRALPAGAALPAAGPLHLELDDDVTLDVPVDHGADTGQVIDAERATVAAARIQAALAGTVHAGAGQDHGGPVTDPVRLAELGRTTVRWDDANRRFVVASGRWGPVPVGEESTAPPSRVRLAAPSPQATGLGLDGDALVPEGHLVRHRIPGPIAMAFDLRLDVWAGSQRHLALLVETWARVTPTRCQLILRPGLPAADVMDGAAEITLQRGGEAPARSTLLQLEPPAGFADRCTGRGPALAGGAAATVGGLVLPAAASATLPFLQPPAVPDPLALPPGGTGWAMSTRLTTSPGAANGETRPLVALVRGGDTVLGLSATWVAAPANGGAAGLDCEVRVTARTGDGVDLPAVGVRVPAARVEAGVEVHALVDAVAGRAGVYADGAGLLGAALPDPHPAAGGDDMELHLGGAGARPVTLGHVQVHGRPAGPLDHRLRASAAGADRWRPGDPVTLTRSDDGFAPRGTPFTATVVRVEGDTLHLDRPVAGTWPRHDTMVCSRLVFSQQTAVRRRDDLASHMTRITLEHTVSGFVEPEGAGASARLVEYLDLQVLDGSEAGLGGRRVPGTPQVFGEFVPSRALRPTSDPQAPPAAPALAAPPPPTPSTPSALPD
ncbi:hypothetical protein [Micromonospora sp. NPDC005806]|uniref:hypothetical protein n=1 Tax=Micromonospora sp. NPDC005806 TaxID=3364234 RepID=UPI0036AA645D